MLPLGLSSADRQKLDKLLVSHHRIAVSVQLMGLEHQYVNDLTKMLLGGQVTIDSEATEATRSCDLELLDPLHKLNLDADSPDDGSMYYTTMIRIVYTVISVDGKDRFPIPIFCGPVNKVDRNGPVLAVSCLGKEVLSMSSVWKGRTYRKGLKKTFVIEQILRELGGERKLQIPNKKPRLPKKLAIGKDQTAWGVATNIARSMGFQLFYDGRGVARMRKLPGSAVFVFKQKESLLSMPQAGYDASAAINAVEVIGGKPKGSKKKITYRIVAPRAHALSPWRMGRWNTPRYLAEVIEDDSIRSKKEAARIAKARLKNLLREQVEVAFDALPVPYLEENDLCRVSSDEFSGSFRLKKMTIPLTANGASSIGYLKRVTPNKRQIRIKNRVKGNKRRNNR